MMINTQAVLDILFMAITVDDEIHEDEITIIKEIIHNTKYNFSNDINQQIEKLHTIDHNVIISRYKRSLKELASLDQEEKRYITKLVMKIIDADKIMHDNELRLLSNIIKEWDLES